MEIKHSERESGGMFYSGDVEKPDAKITYRNTGENEITVIQTFVKPELRGKTIGKQLVHAVGDMAEERGLKVESQCWFASEIFEQR